jgi:hypothetical protein
MRGTDALPIGPEEVDHICLKCHDGRAARAERHPVGRSVQHAGIELPEGWPAPRGRLACLTCHDVSLTAGHLPAARIIAPTNFLRGRNDPDPLAFCAQCHVANAQQARYNPHRMITADGNNQTPACLFCHTRSFKAVELQRRSGAAALKANEITMCIGCHPQHIDFFEPGHIGTRVTPAVRENMTDAALKAGPDSGARTRLPLASERIIVCSTCHNPHEAGVFAPQSTLSLGAMRRQDWPTTQPGIEEKRETARATPVPLRLGAHTCGECHAK